MGAWDKCVVVEWVSMKEMSGVYGWRCDADLSAARTRLEALRVRRTVSNMRRHMQLSQQHDRQSTMTLLLEVKKPNE